MDSIRLSDETPIHLVMYICIIFMFTPLVRQFYLWYEIYAFLFFFLLTLPKFIHSLINNKVMLMVFVFFLIEILYRMIGFSTAGMGNYGFRFMRMISVWMFFYIADYSDFFTKKNVFIVSLLALGANLIDNIRLWVFNANVSELFYRYSSTIGMLNVGRTDFQYCVAVLFLVCFAYFFERRNVEGIKIDKSVHIALIILCCVYLIFFSQSTTMLLTTLLALVSIMVFRKKCVNGQIILRCLFIALCFVCLLLSDYIIKWLIDVALSMERDKLASRLAALALFTNQSTLVSDGDVGTMSRLEMIAIDVQAWGQNFMSFLFGKGYHFTEYSDVITSAINNYSGNHSTLFDILARYGLFGLSLYLGILYNLISRLWHVCVSRNAKVFLIVLVFYVLVNMILNDIGKNNIIFLLLFMTNFLFAKDYYIIKRNERVVLK